MSLLSVWAALTPVQADYALKPVQDRGILLLDLSAVRLDKQGLAFQVDGAACQLRVDRFWMQDRIWSDGICVGVQAEDPRSAATRIVDVQKAIESKTGGLLLVECILPKDGKEWMVTYLRIFSPAAEYPRYFPKREFYDTLKLPDTMQPKTAEEFLAALKVLSGEGLKKLKTGIPPASPTVPAPQKR